MGHQKIPVVLYGGVRHADSYAAIIADDPRLELVGVFESPNAPDWALRDAAAIAHANKIQVLEALPTQPHHLVIVCTEPVRHTAAGIDALRADHHVLVDKPAATTVGDAHALNTASEASSNVCAVVTRCLGIATQRAKQMVDDGHVGFVRSIDIEFLAHGAQFATSVERPELVTDPTLSGGGEIMNFFGYAIDQARTISGCEPVEIMAYASTAFSEAHRTHGVEDLAVASIAMTNGAMASVTVGRIPAAPASAPNASTCRIIGSHGHITIDDNRPIVHRHGATGTTDGIRLSGGAELQAVEAVLDSLIESIVGEVPLPYTTQDALVAMSSIAAAYEAIKTGRPSQVSSRP